MNLIRRRLISAILALLATAFLTGCGGVVNSNSDNNLPNFPFTKTITVTFTNNFNKATNLWMDGETKGAANLVQPGKSRQKVVTVTWLTQNTQVTFHFHADAGATTGGGDITIDGVAAADSQFVGFGVLWDNSGMTISY